MIMFNRSRSALLVLCAIVLTAIVYSLRPTAKPVAVLIREPSATPPAQTSAPASGDDDIPQALMFSGATFRDTKQWFTTPSMDGRQTYAATTTSLELDASCVDEKTINASSSLESALEEKLSLQARQQFPDDVFFSEATQFWQQDGYFYEASAQWEIGQPAHYALDLFRARDAAMELGVERVPLPAKLPKVIDATVARDFLLETISRAVASGAKEGARLLRVNITDPSGQFEHEINFQNSQPTDWYFHSGRCALKASGQSALCKCLPADLPNQVLPINNGERP
jgi:hypothetical protein